MYMTRGTNDDGGLFLSVHDSSEAAYAVFKERGLQGGGYTWIAVLDALAGLAVPPIVGDYDIDGEADNAYVNTNDPAVLDAFEAIVTRAMADMDLLNRAIDAADPEILE